MSMLKNRTDAPTDDVHSSHLSWTGTATASAPGRPRVVADLVGEVAATLERAHAFAGKAADARKLRRRLVLRAAGIEQQIFGFRREMTLASEAGRDFSERKLRGQVRALEEERLDNGALLEEVERVFQRLRRERRTLLYRLECDEAVATAIPARTRRDGVRHLFTEARRALEAPGLDPRTGFEA